MAKTRPIFLLTVCSLSLLSFLLFLPFRTRPPLRTFSHSNLENPFPDPPRIAYFITGSNGDVQRLTRLVNAVFHPRNQYLLHLDLRAPQVQREDLAVWVQSVDVFRVCGNVNVVGKADFVNYRGSTALASILHGAAILLRCSKDWDWFVNLGASDYPLITQDDFLHVLSFVPSDTSFIEHASDISSKEYQRIRRIIVDPGLYLASKSEIFYGSKKRPMSNAYRFFTGSPSVVLSRKLIEYAILGWDNFPRKLLMYFSNIEQSHRGYFHTLVCNSKDFATTVINTDLRFKEWDKPPGKEPRNLKLADFNKMVESGAPFGEKFLPDDPVLDNIDEQILHRGRARTVPGGWCIGRGDRGRDPCHVWGDVDILNPGPGSSRLEKFLLRFMANESFRSHQCVFRCAVADVSIIRGIHKCRLDAS